MSGHRRPPPPPGRRPRPPGAVRLLPPAIRLVLGLALLGVLLLGLTQPGRVAVKTLLLLPDLFPSSPIRPLTLVSGPPRREAFDFDFPAGHIDSDVYLPAEGGRHGAVVLLLGAVGFPRRDPTLVRFADGLCRAGAVVLIPESSNLQQGDILPDEVEGLLRLVDHLRERPEVDPARVGFLGFSVGGSLALLTADSPRGRETVAFVNAFGSYYDARELLRAVAAREILVDGRPVPWEPAELTAWVFARQLIAPLPDERDRELLGRAFVDRDPLPEDDLADLSLAARPVLGLLEQPPPERVDGLIAALPPESQARLDGISPSRGLAGLRAHLYLMHDRSDSYIPFVQSRRLAAAAPAGLLRSFTEFDLFAHVMPDRPLEGWHFAREVVKLYLHTWRFGQEFL